MKTLVFRSERGHTVVAEIRPTGWNLLGMLPAGGVSDLSQEEWIMLSLESATLARKVRT